jgi:outer membrane receptor protein involved in Fe transport
VNRLDEQIEEQGDDYLREPLQIQKQNWTTDFHQLEVFLEDQFTILRNVQVNAGLRYLYYAYTDEQLLSPRVSLHYFPADNHILYFRWGYYFQPPYYLELKYLPADFHKNIHAQRATQTIFGWQYQLRPQLELQVELYYKKLADLIPFYMEDLQIIYTGSNQNEGFARGLDILIRGELIQGLNSWISYSYLDSREREIGNDLYRPKLLDQTHTLRFFVQDQIPTLPMLQFHTRILFGSGYRYYLRQVEEDPASGDNYITINFHRTLKYPYYSRVDMGLSARLSTGKRPEFLAVAEVLNVFNNFNVLGYRWFQVFEDNQGLVPIPRILTKRFFNVGLRVSF